MKAKETIAIERIISMGLMILQVQIIHEKDRVG